MKTLFINIKSLAQIRDCNVKKVVGKDMKYLPSINNAFLLIEDDKIIDFGAMSKAPKSLDNTIDLSERYVLPCWCDPHSHLIFAASREDEFVDRINGLSYEEIANKGGGILNSAKKLQKTSEDKLYHQAEQRLRNIIKSGTAAIEIKSGYGLNEESELKMLRVARRLQKNTNVKIKATFLGAHAIPAEFKTNSDQYVDHIIDEILPKVIDNHLADYIDVFCEKGYFSLEQSERIIKAGQKKGLRAKIHVNQFNILGGVSLGVKYNALSVDHLEVMSKQDILALKNSKTIPTALPSCSFFLNLPYTPARELIDSGLAMALATDYNPGSTPSGNMNFVLSLACIKMKMTPEEAINAATINAAYAMGCENELGSITVGKKASFLITKKVPSLSYLPYAFGDSHIAQVYINGKEVI